MPHAAHVWFLVLWTLSLIGFVTSVARFRARLDAVEKRVGPLPTPIPFAMHVVALVLLVAEVGMLSPDAALAWTIVRWVGIGLSGCALVLLPWALRTLGRLAVPGVGIFRDHRLVTTGPFRMVRNPLYAAVCMLWLGTALGTLNWVMLVLFPFLVFGLLKTARAEERLLREKFGAEYEAYAARTGRIVPRIGAR